MAETGHSPGGTGLNRAYALERASFGPPSRPVPPIGPTTHDELCFPPLTALPLPKRPPRAATTCRPVLLPIRPTARVNVLHVINGEHFSGAERVQDLLALRLPEEGFAADFAALKPGRFGEARRSSTRLTQLPMRGRIDYKVVGPLKNLVRKYDYKILHAHTPRTAPVTAVVARSLDLPWVYHVHQPRLSRLWPFVAKSDQRLGRNVQPTVGSAGDRGIALAASLHGRPRRFGWLPGMRTEWRSGIQAAASSTYDSGRTGNRHGGAISPPQGYRGAARSTGERSVARPQCSPADHRRIRNARLRNTNTPVGLPPWCGGARGIHRLHDRRYPGIGRGRLDGASKFVRRRFTNGGTRGHGAGVPVVASCVEGISAAVEHRQRVYSSNRAA